MTRRASSWCALLGSVAAVSAVDTASSSDPSARRDAAAAAESGGAQSPGDPATAAAGPAVRAVWARPTPPGSSVAAVYLTILGGNEADRLVGASTSHAATVQVHEVTHEGGMTRMREVRGLVVPARARVVLAPEGRHLMVMGLATALVPGERFDITLAFERAGPRTVTVDVIALDAAPPAAR